MTPHCEVRLAVRLAVIHHRHARGRVDNAALRGEDAAGLRGMRRGKW